MTNRPTGLLAITMLAITLVAAACGSTTDEGSDEGATDAVTSTDDASTEDSPASDSTDGDGWRLVSGPGFDGVIIADEGFETALASPRPNGPAPTDAEVEAFEARLVDEITESGIETVPAFEGLTDRLADFRRYYFAGTNVVAEAALDPENLPDEPGPFHPRLTAELDGERMIMVELTALAGDSWQTSYGVVGVEGFDSDQFLALYLPDADVFWLQFELGGELDNIYH